MGPAPSPVGAIEAARQDLGWRCRDGEDSENWIGSRWGLAHGYSAGKCSRLQLTRLGGENASYNRYSHDQMQTSLRQDAILSLDEGSHERTGIRFLMHVTPDLMSPIQLISTSAIKANQTQV